MTQTNNSERTKKEDKPFKGNLYREVAYIHLDERHALANHARKKRCSKSEVIRRALRQYLDIED